MEKTFTGRPQRNRRHSRRAWPPEDDLHQTRAIKRLFTPEIKRMLKDWLIRRRDNPYPSRDEKKRLAIETGLTYTQICNWFANWRRKLKNSERERAKKSWGHLIKNYNTNARGNVEQFSISSEDSIWEEHENELDAMQKQSEDESLVEDAVSCGTDYTDRGAAYFDMMCKTNIYVCRANDSENGATTQNDEQHSADSGYGCKEKTYATLNAAKYKQIMMQKYLRDTHDEDAELQPATPKGTTNGACEPEMVGGGAELSKWLESAAKFTPDKNNYYIEWNDRSHKLIGKQPCRRPENVTVLKRHTGNLQRPRTPHIPTQLELDAAEALANLAFNCRQRLLDTNNSAACTQTTINAISS